MEPGEKLGEPSPKAKYSLATDSEQVPQGKVEKNPGEGSEIEPETRKLTGDGRAMRYPQGYRMPDCVPFA